MLNLSVFRWKKLSFSRRLLLLMTVSGLIKLLILSLAGFTYLTHWQMQEIGTNALKISKYIASTPIVIDAIEQKNPASLTQKIELLRSLINAKFIVVGDNQGIRYTHPIAQRIGQKMQGGDNDKALKYGFSYISYATGSLGNSVRGKSPIVNSQGEIIGVVSVGYLVENIDKKLHPILVFFIVMAFLVVVVNALISNFSAKRFQQAILGFEPEQFARLYHELEVTLSTIKEGVLSIDAEGYIRSINNSACQIFKCQRENVLHQKLRDVLPYSNLTDILLTQQSQADVELILNGQAVIANRQLIIAEGKVLGAVSSFRLKDEITELTKELSQISEYADLLRSQTHEHRNKLNTISGLLQLNKIQDALSLISKENEHYQHLIAFLRNNIEEPVIAGILLGKSERARELNLTLEIDVGSRLQILPTHMRGEDIATIIANLIDNAFDATLAGLKDVQKNNIITVSISDYGQDILLEVEDEGIGLPHSIKQQDLLKFSVSSKANSESKSKRGVGLYLVNKIIKQYRGQLTMESKVQGGTIITAYLPKKLYKESSS